MTSLICRYLRRGTPSNPPSRARRWRRSGLVRRFVRGQPFSQFSSVVEQRFCKPKATPLRIPWKTGVLRLKPRKIRGKSMPGRQREPPKTGPSGVQQGHFSPSGVQQRDQHFHASTMGRRHFPAAAWRGCGSATSVGTIFRSVMASLGLSGEALDVLQQRVDHPLRQIIRAGERHQG